MRVRHRFHPEYGSGYVTATLPKGYIVEWESGGTSFETIDNLEIRGRCSSQ